jgi:polysaccharide biosynthesis protein PslH
MRILQLCTKVPYPPMDGGAAGIYTFSKAFAHLGHQVDVLAVNPPKHFISEQAFKNISETIEIHTVEINTSPQWMSALKNILFTRLPYFVERFVNEAYENKLISLIQINKPDIIQIEGVYMCPYINTIRKYSTAKIVLREHNVEYMLWQNVARNEGNILKKAYLKIQAARLKKFELNQLNKVDGVTTVTGYDMSILKDKFPTLKAEVIPFGIEIAKSHSENTPNLNAILFFGALDWIPNQEAISWFVKNVWPCIRKELPDMQLHIAGRNAPLPLANWLNTQPGILFHGEISDAKLFTKQYTITIVPLFSGSGIRVKIIEAMEQGKIVIASAKAISGIPAVDGEHLFVAESAIDYLNHIKNLISNPNCIEIISENAMKFIQERFNILAITSQLMNFYQDIPKTYH